jgi:hypothetical protein
MNYTLEGYNYLFILLLCKFIILFNLFFEELNFVINFRTTHKALIERLKIEATLKTPLILMDPEGVLKIQGRSIPEDASLFYERVVKWIEEYIKLGKKTTRFDLHFEYLNSGTSKYVLQMLKILKELPLDGHQLIVNWFYEGGDDDILERGEYYSSILDLKINLIETE